MSKKLVKSVKTLIYIKLAMLAVAGLLCCVSLGALIMLFAGCCVGCVAASCLKAGWERFFSMIPSFAACWAIGVLMVPWMFPPVICALQLCIVAFVFGVPLDCVHRYTGITYAGGHHMVKKDDVIDAEIVD